VKKGNKINSRDILIVVKSLFASILMMTKNDLREIPGVGKSIALDLWEIGIRKVEDLKDRDA
jgi:predicted flap endonuclease-1-like 5' DNA nuclease